MSEYKLEGFISGDTFGSNGNSHFSNEDGVVLCGSKNRFGFDCTAEIKFLSVDDFDTDVTTAFTNANSLSAFLRRNHLPLDCFITCKKCQNKLYKILQK